MPAADARAWLMPVSGALLVHLAAALLVGSTLTIGMHRVADEPRIIEAEVIDARAIEAEAQRRIAEQQAAQRAVEQAAAAAQAKVLEQARLRADREAAERRSREEMTLKAQAEKARKEKEAKAAADKRRREAAAQKAREAELKGQVAAEEKRAKAVRAGLLDAYKVAVQQKVQRNWIKPASTPAGLDCEVRVEQLPTGDVVTVEILRCNGDEVVKRSISDAVLRASPLPPPADRVLFDRELVFTFNPDKK